ncbi:trypsin-like peptidase domain-containing protein [Clostridium subterminale]|uniref:Trypsin-like peptidase domain-containing protein n=1 Tax=Clostridium subterminale TaxID=1550 RepID=A0ABP3VYL1_CLOSU
MSNFNDEYKDVKARITFNKIKKKRRGKIVVITIFCLFIASLGGAVTALVMNTEKENYYVQGNDDDKDTEVNTTNSKFQSAAERVSQSVVSVIKVITDDKCTKETNVGVGIVIENGQYVITSYLGIEDATSVKVKLHNDIVYNASIVGFDSIYDIAMIKINGESLKPMTIAKNSTKVEKGDKVISVGNPLGKSFNENIEVSTVLNTRENIVFKNRETKVSESLRMIKTSVVPKFINTGAALCNLDGELIGVNNTSMTYHNEFLKNSFYISAEDLEPIAYGILDKQDSLINHMGVYGEEAISQSENGIDGVYAKEVTRNGLAYEAGIRPTDIIIEVNGVKVNTVSDINSIMSKFKNGDTIKYTVFKNGDYVDFEIKIPE